MGTVLAGMLVVGVSVFVAILGLAVVRRLVPPETCVENHDVAGFISAILGAAYAVMLAFVVVLVWQQFDAAEQISQGEANAVGDVYHIAGATHDAQGRAIQDAAIGYSKSVIADEWPAMANFKGSPKTEQALELMWDRTLDFTQSHPTANTVIRQHLLGQMVKVDDGRTLRLLAARSSVHPILWIVLIVGGLLTITFTYFFGLKSFRAQAVMTGVLTLMISGTLFTVAAIDHPFSGDVSVQSDAFEFNLEHLGSELAHQPARQSSSMGLQRRR